MQSRQQAKNPGNNDDIQSFDLLKLNGALHTYKQCKTVLNWTQNFKKDAMKVDHGQNVRVVVSLLLFVVSARGCFYSSRRFLSSTGRNASSFRRSTKSTRRFLISNRRIVCSIRRLTSSTRRFAISSFRRGVSSF